MTQTYQSSRAGKQGTADQERVRKKFDRCRRALGDLLPAMEQIHEALDTGAKLDDLPGWRELRGRPQTFAQQEGEPVLVSIMFGPTGAGKSTLFSMLTGVEVPSGNEVRPLSYNAVVAVPPELDDAERLADVLPLYNLERLSDPEVLRDSAVPADRLYFARHRRETGGEGLPLIVGDVPDFDSVCQENWVKAESLMKRAELVLFAVYPEAYKHATVVSQLARICRHAGKLSMIFNKSDSQKQSEVQWKDLLEYLKEDERFQQRRQDGLRLHEFLEQSPVYYSPRAMEPKLEDIKPLHEGTPELLSLLGGLDGAKIVLTTLLEDSMQGLRSARKLADEAELELGESAAEIDAAVEPIERAAKLVAGSEFPLGRLLEIIKETVDSYRWKPLKYLSMPIAKMVQASMSVRRQLKKYFSTNREELSTRERIESKKIEEALEELVDAWRDQRPGDPDLTQENCRAAIREFLKVPQPKPGKDWEGVVREKTSAWVKKHPGKTKVIGNLNDLLAVVGGGAVMLDLAVTGGQSTLWGGILAGKLGLIGAAGAGAAGAGIVMKAFEELGMKQIVEAADREWRDMRAQEIEEHIREHLAKPLFMEKLCRKVERLEGTPLERLKKACSELDSLMTGTPL